MSGRWDWDVKSSYTYHALKKAKDVVEKSLNQAAEEIQDSQRKKSQNPPENGMPHQQPPYQAEGDVLDRRLLKIFREDISLRLAESIPPLRPKITKHLEESRRLLIRFTSRLRPNGRKRRTPKSLCPRE